MNDTCRPEFFDQFKDPDAVTDIKFVMFEVFEVSCQPMLSPARIALGAEKDGTLVVVQAMNK